MTQTVRPALQVVDYVRRLAPAPRRAIKQALKDLAREKGDIRALEGVLSGYDRLKVGRHRVIFSYAADGAIEAVFVEDRSLVYEIFEAEFVMKLKGHARHARA
jgi:mRNA interferase RelE/StbE